MSVKRIDRTAVLMRDLEKAADAGVKEAAIMLKTIAREMVSRRYSKNKGEYKGRGEHWDSRTAQVERNLARNLARRRFAKTDETFQDLLAKSKE